MCADELTAELDLLTTGTEKGMVERDGLADRVIELKADAVMST